ncbi:MAG TPA: ATP-binding protein [Nitrospira sp.]|nr:ATP-binding protein [Nitrospira sp.]
MARQTWERPLVLYLVVTAGALLAGAIIHALWPDWRWHHEPLHSTIEAVGGLVAIAMAAVLLQTHDESVAAKYRALAAGFLGMGILEEFHAIVRPGDGFVLFRNMASLAGGIGFVLAWRSHADTRQGRRWDPWLIAAGALCLGLWFLIFPSLTPEMVRNGEFTATAIAPQILACLLFLVAAVRFLWDYRRSGRSDDALFASLALLLGLAEFVFLYSIPWDTRWWFWHSLRLMASLLALGYISRRYAQMTSDVKASLGQALNAQETLRQSEGRLRQMLGEREHMAEDLHDSTIQSLFAIGLNLERCQRLVSSTHHEVGTQLSSAVSGLKAVIRDLRGYILGIRPSISNGRALEEMLTSLVEEMTRSSPIRFHLHLDTLAADRLTAEQATQVVPIAREAMSNSIRHSAGQEGSVSLQIHDGSVRLIVEDDGVGFDAATVASSGDGLKNMARRVRDLAGRLVVSSEPGRGTRVICDFPQERDHAAI